ncbi:hypothetical protein HG536_0E00680 [Torulaspora globosa]|uniref:Mitochondrial translation factor ATP22 n=1 Tax=Torulaspora globosa TaxID=48254 RepID=A0A7G3ZI22_9SACH|nr:uncharacterized protein HG536_0E00680 [Torulaspora globosa]QLL33158.1 hypothetical protein HG536_0E00680 [Torulaspora globosa]
MLWACRRFGNSQLAGRLRWKSTATSAVPTNEKDVQKAASNIDEIYQLVNQVTTRDLSGERPIPLLKLGGMIDSIANGHEMRRVRNKLQRKFGMSYNTVFTSLLRVVADPSLFKMSMFRRLGWKQYYSFVNALRSTIGDRGLSNDQKKQKLYRIISFQHDLFPKASEKAGYLIPTDVHQWFWENLPRDESFNHLYFLIKNDVLLSSCPYVWNFSKRLMQGSELEMQLATFEIFFHDKAHQGTFQQKFGKLHSFYAMNKLVNKVLSGKDFRFIKLYLSSLLQKMESLKEDGDRPDTKSKKTLFIRFSNTLLFYLSQTGNVEMFLQTFEISLQYMRKARLLKDARFMQEYLNPSFHFILKLLRQKGLQEQVFHFIRVIQRVIRRRDPKFSTRVVGELVSSLRSFNDPKLSCEYILSAFNIKQTAALLNDLGLWGAIFHENSAKLSQRMLEAETKVQEKIFPRSLQIEGTPSIPILTELYRVLLSTCARTMGHEMYQGIILELYSSYKKALEDHRFPTAKHDTGILSVFLYHIRLELNNSKLAFEVLKDFYSQKFASSVRCTTKSCPFSYVVYKNYDLTQSDLSHLLHLMQLNRVPLQFRFCTAMVLRYLKLGNVTEAYLWYRKILHAGFEVDHFVLIKAITANGWEYPKNFDMSLLHRIDQRTLDSNEDALFLGESNELDDPNAISARGEDSLLRAINLVEELRGPKANSSPI